MQKMTNKLFDNQPVPEKHEDEDEKLKLKAAAAGAAAEWYKNSVIFTMCVPSWLPSK